jgi:hypothetical protein
VDGAAAVDAQNAPTAAWKTRRRVSHTAHRHSWIQENEERGPRLRAAKQSTILTPPTAWPLFKRSSVAAFERSVTFPVHKPHFFEVQGYVFVACVERYKRLQFQQILLVDLTAEGQDRTAADFRASYLQHNALKKAITAPPVSNSETWSYRNSSLPNFVNSRMT